MTNRDDEKILPCPFCGAKATIEETDALQDGHVLFSVGCDSDREADCMGYQSFTVFNTRKEAIDAWNRRDYSHVRNSAEWKAMSEVIHELRKYVLRDDCDADGAPDADNSRHSETCYYCSASTALHTLDRLRGDK